MSYKNKLFVLVFTLIFLFAFNNYVEASQLNKYQISAIINLLRSFKVNEKTINVVDSVLHGNNAANLSNRYDSTSKVYSKRKFNILCNQGIRPRRPGARDEEVKEIQEFLKEEGYFEYPEITGYYGYATIKAIQKFQRDNNIVSSGSIYDSGYGLLGPKTSRKIEEKIRYICDYNNDDTSNNDNSTNLHKLNKDNDNKKIDDNSTEKKDKNCSDGLGHTYKEGGKTHMIKNKNGSIQNLTDAYYVCRGGTWKVEGSYPRLYKTDDNSRERKDKNCEDGFGNVYRDGDKTKKIKTKNGSIDVVRSYYKAFICRSGKWRIERTYPPAPNTRSCSDGLGHTYKEGGKTHMIKNKNGSIQNLTDAYYVCRGGTWKVEGYYPPAPNQNFGNNPKPTVK